jgi:hypothetical protein
MVLAQTWYRWDRLLAEYRTLDYNDRPNTRFPLANSSWPNFDSTWGYTHVRLYTLNEKVSELFAQSELLLNLMGWEDWNVNRLPQGAEATIMVDYLVELQEFTDYLKEKMKTHS